MGGYPLRFSGIWDRGWDRVSNVYAANSVKTVYQVSWEAEGGAEFIFSHHSALQYIVRQRLHLPSKVYLGGNTSTTFVPNSRHSFVQ